MRLHSRRRRAGTVISPFGQILQCIMITKISVQLLMASSLGARCTKVHYECVRYPWQAANDSCGDLK